MFDTSYCEGDTIATESTPPGRAGISVIRISGAQAAGIVQLIFDRELPGESSLKFGRLHLDGQPEVILDEAVAAYFKAPHSYTGEDVIELSVHGNPVVVASVLSELYKVGARPAERGEFTLRAFLNGRIDLTQAEAVADLVGAVSPEAANRALGQLQGNLRKAAEHIGELINQVLVWCEVELDFVEDDVELASSDDKVKQIDAALQACRRLTEGYNAARIYREGVTVAIIGAPNVGKSSLFNALLGRDRAIVHAQPGTTRDVISGETIIKGVRFELFDTAGIRISRNEVEDEGIRRALETSSHAHIRIHVTSLDDDELVEIKCDPKCEIWVLNKCDLGELPPCINALPVSAKTGKNLDLLKNKLLELSLGDETPKDAVINRERHYRALEIAQEALIHAQTAVRESHPVETTAEELREALASIDSITGKRHLDDLLDSVFSQFCIGK
ncbi:MAG: tRNA uridine-5-carboxymethylaminomethyl(34) synthesis GTPase MnmE [Calditrichota bacterium]